MYVAHSWPPQDTVHSDYKAWLRQLDPAFPKPNVITFILFDEGQDSYEDRPLWSGFLKDVHGRLYNDYRVILFCTYGNPSARPVDFKMDTSIVIRDEALALVSLQPRETSVGLLINRLEFDEVVARQQQKLHVHSDILDHDFEWTAGHIGAIARLLPMFSCQVSLQHVTLQVGVLLTIDSSPPEAS